MSSGRDVSFVVINAILRNERSKRTVKRCGIVGGFGNLECVKSGIGTAADQREAATRQTWV
jgi:hypothetical protein